MFQGRLNGAQALHLPASRGFSVLASPLCTRNKAMLGKMFNLLRLLADASLHSSVDLARELGASRLAHGHQGGGRAQLLVAGRCSLRYGDNLIH